MATNYTVKTCGKLYLSGEYAILYPNQLALVKNIPIYMTANIRVSPSFQLQSDLFTYTVDREKDQQYGLIQESIDLFEAYLGRPLDPFHLQIKSDMATDGKKYGIGSSGSVVVLTLKALAAFEGLTLSPNLLFKLACLVLLSRGDNGSMGDLACIAYDDLVFYRSFDRELIRKKLQSQSVVELLNEDWGYEIEPVKVALPLTFLVGWTQEPAISKDLVKQVKDRISPAFLDKSNQLSQALKRSLESGQGQHLISIVKDQQDLLEHLHPVIMTPRLSQLVTVAEQYGGAAKSSGAGGGDCGITYLFDTKKVASLVDAWSNQNITCLYHEEWGNHES